MKVVYHLQLTFVSLYFKINYNLVILMNKYIISYNTWNLYSPDIIINIHINCYMLYVRDLSLSGR